MEGRRGSLSQTTWRSSVPNYLRYATVRRCLAVYRIMYEASAASRANLGRYEAWAPRPGTCLPRIPVDVRGQLPRVQVSRPSRLSGRAIVGLSKAASRQAATG